MKNKKWELRSDMGNSASIDNSGRNLAQFVLSARGIEGEDEVKRFLSTDLDMLFDPFLIADMDKAVSEIEQAIAQHKRIAVYGDYDVDGVTSTCILIRYLKSRGAACQYYIPDRINEGYGLNIQAIDSLREDGVELLITVDSGITAIEETEYAHSVGMRVVITDHHECKEDIPKAESVVNPRRLDCGYPFKELAGVGVAFKLLCALEKGKTDTAEMIKKYGDVVAIGTIADVMPLVSENRAIVFHGLKILEKTKNKGLCALMKKINIYGKSVSASNVSFMMAPRINAAGRLGGASNAAKMLLTEDDCTACEIAELLCEMNCRRQLAENEIYSEIAEKIEAEYDSNTDKAIVMWGENWHNGVIGIVASRITEKYFVPTILISLDEGKGKGSGRSIKGFNLYQALEKNCEWLEKYGGHEMAVGLTIDKDKLEDFKKALCSYCFDILSKEEIVPTITVDCEIESDMLTMPQVESLEMLEPFGMGNPQPVFIVRNMLIEELTPIGKDKHVKLLVSGKNNRFYALGFGLPTIGCQLTPGDRVDIVGTADISEYRGCRSVQMIIKDIKLTENEINKDLLYKEIYEEYAESGFADRDDARILLPSRDDIVAVFRNLKSNVSEKIHIDIRSRKVKYESKSNMNPAKYLVCLDVMKEFGIVEYEREGFTAKIRMHDIGKKVDLNTSAVLRKLRELFRG